MGGDICFRGFIYGINILQIIFSFDDFTFKTILE